MGPQQETGDLRLMQKESSSHNQQIINKDLITLLELTQSFFL